jgi:hypothetical protein
MGAGIYPNDSRVSAEMVRNYNDHVHTCYFGFSKAQVE